MTKAIMVQGTTSSAGKSFLTAALCRIFAQDGDRVAPFKAQNMALNSFITSEGLEMGRAQVMQAEAAGIEPSVRMNPVLLKPSSDTGSQVIVNGEVRGNMSAKDYFKIKHTLVPDIMEAYHALAKDYDIIVLEGAGSPAEINLKEGDIVNMGMARRAKAPVLLVADIDRGGVFASLAGTLMLLDEDERAMVKGLVINRFRGDPSILQPGVEMIERITGVPVVGVIPYLSVILDEEDSLAEKLERETEPAAVDIAVIRLPHMSNFTDFLPLESLEGVSLRYVKSTAALGNPDLIILPGTKNTIGDLLWLRQSGLEASILKHAASGGSVLGICGGFQMLGNALCDPEGVEHQGTVGGLGLLPHETVFRGKKVRTQVQGMIGEIGGVLAGLSGATFEGYETHMGETTTTESPFAEIRLRNARQTTIPDGGWQGNIYGSYIHGLFDCAQVVEALVAALCKAKGIDRGALHLRDRSQQKQEQYDLLATAVREHIDMQKIYSILEAGL